MKIRVKLLVAFSAVLFFSFLCTGIIFNIAVRFRAGDADHLLWGDYIYAEHTGLLGRAGLMLFILIGVMFIISVVVSYFLANSITKPIEDLGRFALDIGSGNFACNDFKFNELELEDLNNALNKSARQLSAYDHKQKTFFQNASHELRTPLMAIKCYAEGINFGIMEPQAASETILQETDKLAELVTDILYLSKLDSITPQGREQVNLTQVLQTSAARQEVIAQERGIKFTQPSTGDVYYNGPKEQLTRVVDNLISNALRYAKSEITLNCIKMPTAIVLTVADDGSGIEPALLPNVFERFYKGKNGNHGIGLAIVKSIVAGEGGSITAQNTPEGGALFTITLPS